MDFTKTVLVTHKNCMDGSTCAILFMAAGGKRENIYFSDPAHPKVDELLLSLLNGSSDIMLADISISKALAEHLEKSGMERHIEILLDHHNSAVDLDDFAFCMISTENSRCGSMMLYDWLLEDHTNNHSKIRKYKRLVELVDDYDRWIHNYPESSEIADLHKNLGSELFINRFLHNQDTDPTAQENYLIEVYNRKKESVTKLRKQNVKKITKVINGKEYKIGFVVAPGDDQSALAHAICDDPAMDVQCVVVVNGEGVSLRARDDCDLDLSEVAKLNGGGGHRLASGCNLSAIFGRDFLELIAEKMKFGG